MAETQLTHFNNLVIKFQNLLKLIDELLNDEERLKHDLSHKQTGALETDYLQQIAELKKEVRRLKKENKIYREREKLIKNKVERLAVKLENLEL